MAAVEEEEQAVADQHLILGTDAPRGPPPEPAEFHRVATEERIQSEQPGDPRQQAVAEQPAETVEFSPARIVLLTSPGVLMATLDQSVLAMR